MVNGHQTYVYVGLGGEGENIAEGGMYRKADGGEGESIAKGLPNSPQVRALAIHPNNPSTVFAGTQEQTQPYAMQRNYGRDACRRSVFARRMHSTF